MKKFARLALALAMTTGLTLTGAAAAQAAPVNEPVQSVAAGGFGGFGGGGGGSCDSTQPSQPAQPAQPCQPAQPKRGLGLCPSCCATFKYLHYTAEMLVDTVGMQPLLGIIDKPIIHPLLWSPLNAIFGPCGGDSHPAELG